jgi:hypothetical protein
MDQDAEQIATSNSPVSTYWALSTLLFEDITAHTFADAPVPVEGYMHIPDLPGLGLNLDLDFIIAHDEGA